MVAFILFTEAELFCCGAALFDRGMVARKSKTILPTCVCVCVVVMPFGGINLMETFSLVPSLGCSPRLLPRLVLEE